MRCKNCGARVPLKVVEWLGETICIICYDELWQKCFSEFMAELIENPYADVEVAINRHFCQFTKEYRQQVIKRILRVISDPKHN